MKTHTNTVRIQILPPGALSTSDLLARRLGVFVLVVSLLIVLFAGMFPFDFRFPDSGILQPLQWHFDWAWNPYDPGYVDRTENILFFAPLGLGLASVIRPRRYRVAARLGAALVLGAALSVLVEVGQAYVSFRDPSLADIWSNAMGSLLGAGLFVAAGDKSLRYTARGLLRLRPLAKPAVVGAALIAYSLFHLSVPLLLRSPGDLSVWDPGMPLMVGNELTGDRGWNGSACQVVLADRAATPEEAMELARGADPGQVLAQALLAHYELAGKAPYPDQSGRLKPLNWAHEAPQTQLDLGVAISPANWLKSPSALASAIYRIGQTGQFTLATTVSTFDQNQRGPARVVSISSSPRAWDLQLGQEFADLSVRVRTAVRSMPDLYLRDVFADTSLHHLIVTHRDAQVVIYVDGSERGRIEITPEAKVIWGMYPRGGFRLRIEKYGFRTYAGIYRLLVFIPFAALLAATVTLSQWPTKTRRTVALAAVVGMALVLEIILGTESTSGFQVKNLLMSLSIAFATLALLRIRRRPASRAA